LALLSLALFQISLIFQSPSSGWDYHMVVGAVQSYDHMQNPYLLENINKFAGGFTGGDLLFDYPPHTLYFFLILDIISVYHNIWIYYGLLLSLMILSFYLLIIADKSPHYLFLTTLLITGFMATFWNFITGNKDIFFLCLFAFIFVLLLREKYWQSSIVMGLSAAISLFTAPFSALYLFIKHRSLLNRMTYILISGLVVGLLFLASYCINPVFISSYLNVLQGGTSPFLDSGGLNTPTPYLMLEDFLKWVNLRSTLPTALLFCGYIAFILYASWNYSQNNKEYPLKIYSVSMIAIFMLLPRIKPYDFIILIVPLYFIFKDCSYRIKSLVLAVLSIPMIVWYFQPLIAIPDLPFMLSAYRQTYSLVLIFIVIIFLDYMFHRSHSTAKNITN
jgi:hypothetical protein